MVTSSTAFFEIYWISPIIAKDVRAFHRVHLNGIPFAQLQAESNN